MGMTAKTVCATAHCPRAAVKRGRCEQHSRRINGWQWRRTVRAVVARDNGVCWICGKPGATSADHVHRWADGGTDNMRNLRAAHVHCNMKRG